MIFRPLKRLCFTAHLGMRMKAAATVLPQSAVLSINGTANSPSDQGQQNSLSFQIGRGEMKKKLTSPTFQALKSISSCRKLDLHVAAYMISPPPPYPAH